MINALKIISSTAEPAFALDRNGIIRAWNRAAESLFGYSATAVEGRPCWEVLCGCDSSHNDYCGRSCPVRHMAYGGKSVNTMRLLFRLASQERKPFLVSTLVLYNGPGEVLMAHICRPDIMIAEAGPARPETKAEARLIPLSNNRRRGALTQRQIEVLSLLGEGKSTREIAALMCISINTVRNHVSQVLFRLHVHSRVEAVALARKLGVI